MTFIEASAWCSSTEDGLTVAPASFRVNDLIHQPLKNLKLQDTITEYLEVLIDASGNLNTSNGV